ncbi:MAG: hypothetical protein WC975_09175 [Phycisphaerae bacterium]
MLRKTIFFETLEGGKKTVVVKDISGNTHVKDPEQLLRIHTHITRQENSLAASLPKIFGIDRDRCLIRMEYIPGSTLETILKSKLKKSRDSDPNVTETFNGLAELFAAMTRLKPSEAGMPFTPWQNRNVLSTFEPLFTRWPLRHYLPLEINTLQKFYDKFNGQVFSRIIENLMLVDCQPKNILVAEGGSLRLIDMDYAVTNPALAVAHFLISLDRLGLTRPFNFVIAKIAAWQRCFLSAFFKHSEPDFIEDLAFFYPTTLLRVCNWHEKNRKWAAPYLRWYYGNRLKNYLIRLGNISFPADGKSLANLFGGD